MTSEPLLPLDLLRAGDTGEIADVSGEPGWVRRMAELGVRHGATLRVVTPGCPCLLQVGPSRLSLRGDDVCRILVRPAV